MKLGAMNFPVFNVMKEIENFHALGFDYVELAMDPPEAHYLKLKEKISDIRRALEERGMGLICHLPSFVSYGDLSPVIREAALGEMASSLEVARKLGAKKVVLHPPFLFGLGRYVPELARPTAMESLRAVLKKALGMGLLPLVENLMPRSSFMISPEEFEGLFQEFPEVRMTLDTGHARLAGGSDGALEFVRRFPDRVGHLHLSDNLAEKDDHLPIGTGRVDFGKLVRALKEVDYDGDVTFEIFSSDRDYLKISREKFLGLWKGA